jgi:hypothetical protein
MKATVEKVSWLLEEMTAPYDVVNVIPSISCHAATSAALNAAPRKFVFDAGLISTTTVTRSGTKVSRTIVQLHLFRGSGVIASSCPIRSGVLRKTCFRKEATMTAIKKTPSVLGWYRILRAHYAFTAFQAVRYALWLAR